MTPADLRVMRLLVDAALAQRAAPEDSRAREDYAEASGCGRCAGVRWANVRPELADRVRALLRAYGPATVRDLALVTSRSPRRVRQVLPAVAVVVRPQRRTQRHGSLPAIWGAP